MKTDHTTQPMIGTTPRGVRLMHQANRSFVLSLCLASTLCLGACGKEEESTAQRMGAKVGQTLTGFTSGVGQGIDQQMVVSVELSDELSKRGLTKTVAKSQGLGEKGIAVYLIAASTLKGDLVARALDKNNAEVGRAVAEVDFAADDAKYVAFQFDQQMDTQLVARYAISLKKAS